MRKYVLIIFALLLCLALGACTASIENGATESQTSSKPAESTGVAENDITVSTEQSGNENTVQNTQTEDIPMKETQFYIKANGTTFVADFTDNSSADALRELLRKSDLSIDMHDYGSFEKVGSIGQSLPQKDTQTSTTTGDIVLYQGDQIVIFYGNNSWSYSRLGKIQNVTKDDLLSVFGKGNVTVTFSLSE